MLAWEQIQKTIDYIEEHIGEEIEIEKLAEIASLSSFYFQRLFQRLVKCPVAEYIKMRRLARAKEALAAGDEKILDIALQNGFATHEHFSRTFKKAFGMTPNEFRKNPKFVNTMTKPELLLNYTLVDENVPLITDQIVLEIFRKQFSEGQYYAGYMIKVPISYGDGLGVNSGEDPMTDLWDKVHDIKERNKMFEKYKNGEEIGIVLFNEDSMKPNGTYQYYAGARAEKTEPSDDSLSYWELQKGEYLVCSIEAENFEDLVTNALYKAQKYLAETFITNHHLNVAPYCVEYYETHTPDTNKMDILVQVI